MSGLWCYHGVKGDSLSGYEFNTLTRISKGERIEMKQSDKINTSFIKNTDKKARLKTGNPTIEEVREHIRIKKRNAKNDRISFIELKAGDIHKELRMSNAMPTVCNGMYQLVDGKDEILYQPPKELGSRVRIRYYLI